MKITAAKSLFQVFLLMLLVGGMCVHRLDGPGPLPLPVPGARSTHSVAPV